MNCTQNIMSTALASARRRRAGQEAATPVPGVRQTNPQPSFPGAPQQNMSQGLTLPQVIALVDKRLTVLEQSHQLNQSQNQIENDSEFESEMRTVIEEYNARFDIIADELALLKDTVLKLQTYTMEVNKTLMQDRIRILSDEPTPLEQALNSVSE
jgi:hypothetical protein